MFCIFVLLGFFFIKKTFSVIEMDKRRAAQDGDLDLHTADWSRIDNRSQCDQRISANNAIKPHMGDKHTQRTDSKRRARTKAVYVGEGTLARIDD
jgi:hypothetical protein